MLSPCARKADMGNRQRNRKLLVCLQGLLRVSEPVDCGGQGEEGTQQVVTSNVSRGKYAAK